MPLDVEPVDGGEFRIVDGVVEKIAPGVTVAGDVSRYRAHDETCPNMDVAL